MRKLTDIMAFVKMFFSGGRCAGCVERGGDGVGAAAFFGGRWNTAGRAGQRRGWCVWAGVACGGWRMACGAEAGMVCLRMGRGGGGFFSDKESPCGASAWGALGGW